MTHLSQLPDKVWTMAPNDRSGTQFYTRVAVSDLKFEVMLDGGSGVNSTTEELVVKILNHEKSKGINLGDRRHPIKQLETWPQRESLRGVVGGKSLNIIGGAVINLKMLKIGESELIEHQLIGLAARSDVPLRKRWQIGG